MEINDAILLRRETENKIRKLMEDFRDKTGLDIREISLVYLSSLGFRDVLAEVKCDVRLK